jgi:hypothetical protein
MNVLRRRRLGSAAAVPHPNISGLQARLIADTQTFTDAAFTSVAAADGTTVLGWKDQSGNAFHFTATTGPVLKLGIVGGRPVIRFNGSTQFMVAVAGALGMFQNVAGGTICGVVASPATTARSVLALASVNASSSSRFSWERSTSSAHVIAGRRLDADTFQSVTGSAFTANVFTADFAIARWASAGAELWSNGVKVASSGAFQTAGNTSNSASNQITLGGIAGTTGLAVDIAEIEFYNRDLTDAERQSLERYYKARYKLIF